MGKALLAYRTPGLPFTPALILECLTESPMYTAVLHLTGTAEKLSQQGPAVPAPFNILPILQHRGTPPTLSQ